MSKKILFIVIILIILVSCNKVEEIKNKWKIMPLGDSITEGDEYGGYRINLKQKLDNAGYNTDFVGRKTTNGNSPDFTDKEHEGYNSATINTENYPYLISEELEKGIIEAYKPDIILLLIGTNDIFCQCKNEVEIKNSLSELIDNILKRNENVIIIVGTIPPLGKSREKLNEIVNKVNPLLPEMISSKEKRVYLVDINSKLDRNLDLSDDIHPNREGYEKIADVWFKKIEEIINA